MKYRVAGVDLGQANDPAAMCVWDDGWDIGSAELAQKQQIDRMNGVTE